MLLKVKTEDQGVGTAAGTTRFTQTLLSWKAAPPTGATGTSTAMPLCPYRLRISLTASTASACAGTAISNQRTRVLVVLAAAHRVFDASEEVLRIAVLRGRAFHVPQLTIQTALVLRKGARNDDVEVRGNDFRDAYFSGIRLSLGLNDRVEIRANALVDNNDY